MHIICICISTTDALKLIIWTNSIYVKILYSALFARDIITKCILNNLMGMLTVALLRQFSNSARLITYH